ncbi:CerR family C-terminal domain-containing protein [Chelativorans sp. AA-79]|uniref:CerR family C-terminal domain-containing protein n=1 Tax=Chelativorans sp. AA-79 TaxID=3028735 RepID=UPI0023F896D0|nr:CerR family C-terminal domain-containing protein [Chelativorans sp. AA-79]WEX09376.1 CerR family C-terminal domain-containing protein [Chelativorans sp. AA-79]
MNTVFSSYDFGRPARLSGAERTREALIRAGLKLFGEQGFEATSTRSVAAEANANIGSIAYHFGGKEGLQTACAEYIVETLSDVAERTLGDFAGQQEVSASPEEARAMLCQVVRTMAGFVVAAPEAGEFVQFLLRELTHPTGVLDIVYAGVFEPTHERLCKLWEAATGESADSEETKIAVFTIIGQVIYFRVAREAVLRRMGWSDIGRREANAVIEQATRNLKAVLDARKRKS